MRSVKCECGNMFVRKTSGDKFRTKCGRCLVIEGREKLAKDNLDESQRNSPKVEARVAQLERQYRNSPKYIR